MATPTQARAAASAAPPGRGRELTALARAETARVARGRDGLSGGLEPPATAAESIAAAVGHSNAEHFFVGTQDEKLRERLRKARAAGRAATPLGCLSRCPARCPQVQGVPILFVHSTGVGLELPTEEQRHEAVRAREALQATRAHACGPVQENRGVVPAHERHALQLEPGAATRVHTNVQFKRNKAKGPNPLSVKKKKRPASPPPQRPSCEARASAPHVPR